MRRGLRFLSGLFATLITTSEPMATITRAIAPFMVTILNCQDIRDHYANHTGQVDTLHLCSSWPSTDHKSSDRCFEGSSWVNPHLNKFCAVPGFVLQCLQFPSDSAKQNKTTARVRRNGPINPMQSYKLLQLHSTTKKQQLFAALPETLCRFKVDHHHLAVHLRPRHPSVSLASVSVFCLVGSSAPCCSDMSDRGSVLSRKQDRLAQEARQREG